MRHILLFATIVTRPISRAWRCKSFSVESRGVSMRSEWNVHLLDTVSNLSLLCLKLLSIGKVEIKWPPNHNSSPTSFGKSISGGGTQMSGFCYIIFECEEQVQRLVMDSVERKGRLFLSSKINLKP